MQAFTIVPQPRKNRGSIGCRGPDIAPVRSAHITGANSLPCANSFHPPVHNTGPALLEKVQERRFINSNAGKRLLSPFSGRVSYPCEKTVFINDYSIELREIMDSQCHEIFKREVMPDDRDQVNISNDAALCTRKVPLFRKLSAFFNAPPVPYMDCSGNRTILSFNEQREIHFSIISLL